MQHAFITVTGAKEHNLKNVTVSIPRDKLVVLTGLSGSGKSSLTFDTIYAEGQRRYVESLSAYARQFLEMMQKPDVEHIEGLSPAISIEQKTTSRNPRSTVGTVTEIYDYMRLLWARIGVPVSPATGQPITSHTVAQIVDAVMGFEEGARLRILSPVVRARKGVYKKELLALQQKGFLRLRIDGETYELPQVPRLSRHKKHDVEVIVDRLVLHAKDRARLAESIETALELSDGLCMVENMPTRGAKQGETRLFSTKFACPVSGFTIEDIEPRLFSFNAPHGACAQCEGLGRLQVFDENLVVPDPGLSLAAGAIAPWAKSLSPYYRQTLEAVARHAAFDLHTAFGSLSATQRKLVLHGSGNTPIEFEYRMNRHNTSVCKPFEGVIGQMRRRYRETESAWSKEELERFQRVLPCKSCDGSRLNPQARCVQVDGLSIDAVCGYSIDAALAFFTDLLPKLSPQKKAIATPILRELCNRLHFLVSVGLSYLTLSRAASTLSGGEGQRIRLSSQICSGLTGVLYVLDEPSIGLHQRDNARLFKSLCELRDQGNSVLVVEHDEDAIRLADHLIDMGPGAGTQGGEIVFNGTPAQMLRSGKSLTAAYLRGSRSVPTPAQRRKLDQVTMITLAGASGHNLKHVDLHLPLERFVCITGVSGSGKSTLIFDTLHRALKKCLGLHGPAPENYKNLSGWEALDKVIDIDQSPIGRTPRSNPATYTGAFTPIREWFAALPESRMRGYKPARFSFNVKGGRCEACGGDGVIKIEMHFLPDIYVTCDACRGKRYDRETLAITFRGKTIHDVLGMTISQGVQFFSAVPAIRDKLKLLERVGLGYVTIGQPATTLSGGEAQRVKLSREMARRATGRTLYILDEPTTGLHFEDIRKLTAILHALVDAGNSVVIIEHNLDVVKQADYVVDLGPEGGDGGGRILFEGTPEQLCDEKNNATGAFLRKHMQRDTIRTKKTTCNAAP